MWPMWDISAGWWWLGLWMLLFWGAIIALMVWVVKRLTGKQDYPGRQSPLDIARERYAKGEIIRAGFEQIKKDLS